MGARVFLTLPGVRVFFIDGRAKRPRPNGFTGVNEVKFRNGRIVREGLKTTLSELRLAKSHRSARARWNANVGAPSIFVISRERAKAGLLLARTPTEHATRDRSRSVVNPDTGKTDPYRRRSTTPGGLPKSEALGADSAGLAEAGDAFP